MSLSSYLSLGNSTAAVVLERDSLIYLFRRHLLRSYCQPVTLLSGEANVTSKYTVPVLQEHIAWPGSLTWLSNHHIVQCGLCLWTESSHRNVEEKGFILPSSAVGSIWNTHTPSLTWASYPSFSPKFFKCKMHTITVPTCGYSEEPMRSKFRTVLGTEKCFANLLS